MDMVDALERGERPHRPCFRGDSTRLMRETTWRIVSHCWRAYEDRIAIGDLIGRLKVLQRELMEEREEHEAAT